MQLTFARFVKNIFFEAILMSGGSIINEVMKEVTSDKKNAIGYSPLNSGLRFSRKARTPSL